MSNAIASSSHAIDPALIAIPNDNDDILSDGPTIAKAQGHSAAAKVAGAHQKGKGKKKEVTSKSKGHGLQPEAMVNIRKRKKISDDEDELDEDLKHGGPRGAGNYMAEDVSVLLDLVEKELPLGQRGWQTIHRQFTKWACLNCRPEHALKSLETKYKQVGPHISSSIYYS